MVKRNKTRKMRGGLDTSSLTRSFTEATNGLTASITGVAGNVGEKVSGLTKQVGANFKNPFTTTNPQPSSTILAGGKRRKKSRKRSSKKSRKKSRK